MLHALKLNKYRDTLHTLRAWLDDRASDRREEAAHSVGGDESPAGRHSTDVADVSSDRQDIAVSIGLAEHEADVRRAIDDALERIKTGTFGICEECHAVIGALRLDAIPYARYCVRCEQRIERGNRS